MPAIARMPPRSRAASAGRTRSPAGAKRIAASSGSGGGPAARRDVDGAVVKAGDLDDDVRRGTEAVEAEALALPNAAPLVGAVADDAGAKERRQRRRRNCRRQRVGERRGHDDVIRVPPVDVPAGESRRETEVFVAQEAEAAAAARRIEPGYAD